jgi:hypothetical protein
LEKEVTDKEVASHGHRSHDEELADLSQDGWDRSSGFAAERKKVRAY